MKKIFADADRSLLIVFGVLLVFGLLMLASAGAPLGFTRFSDPYFFIKRQLLLGFLPGIIGFIIAQKIPISWWRQNSLYIFGGAIFMLILVLIPGIGQEYSGAQSWIDIGPVHFQPSEFLKLGLIIYLAAWLSSHSQALQDFNSGFLPFFALLGLSVGLILLQPDVGTATIVALIAVSMYLLAGAPWRYLMTIMATGLVALAGLVAIAPYRFSRIMVFLNPDSDPLGVGYQIKQAFIAVGSGGFWGRGYGLSRSKYQYLPEAAGDSVYAIVAEELGFVVAVLIVLLFVFVLWRSLKIAQRLTDPFAQLVISGIAVWITGQAFINIGAMVGVFPLTGIPLPFISYGGTSLAAILLAVGLMIQISKTAKPV